MKAKLIKFTLLFLILLSGFTDFLPARSIAIVTSGGDQDSRVNAWRRENIRRACEKFKAKGIRECKEAFDKATFLDHLKGAVKDFQCGDTLVLYFNGHGDRTEGFCFDRESSRSANRLLDEKEIMDILKDISCCSKVFIAIHSCYSGRYTAKLAEDPHVVAAVSSSSATRPAHKQPTSTGVNRRNWPDGFVDGFGDGEDLFDAFQRGAQKGKAAAEEKGGNKGESWDDDPQDFKRGHIEEITDTPEGMLVRLKAGLHTVTILLPKSKGTNVPGIRTQDLLACMDITVSDEAFFSPQNKFSPRNPTVKIDSINAKFHVLRVLNEAGRRVRVVFVYPPSLCCSPREITLDKLPAGITFCKYYNAKTVVSGSPWVAVNPVETTGDPYPIEVRGHVVEANPANGILVVNMDSPIPGQRKIRMKRGEALPPWVKVCNIVVLTGHLTETEVQEVSSIDAVDEIFKGHLDGFDQATGTMTVSMSEDNREGVKNRTLEAVLQQPGSLPQGLVPCNDIIFKGKLRGDKIEEANSVNKKPG